jgi:stage V sporulation protein B
LGKNINKSSFAKQAAILAAAGLFVRFIGFVYRLPLTALIGDAGNDIYSTGYYIYNFFLIASSAGLPVAISKMVSERVALKQYRNAHKVFRVSLMLTTATGIIGAVVMWYGAETFAKLAITPESKYAIQTLSPTVFIVAIMSSFRGYFQGLKTNVPTAISQIIEQIFNAVFSVLLAYLWLGKGLEFAAAGGTVGTGVGAFSGLLFLILTYIVIRPNILKKAHKNLDHTEEEETLGIAKTLLQMSAVIIAGTAIMSVTNLIDLTMVKNLLHESGFFTDTQIKLLYGQLTGKFYTITTLPVALSAAFATSTIPHIASSLVLKDREGVKRKINTALRLTMLLSIPAAIGIGVLGVPIIKLLYPSAPAGGEMLTIGAASIIFLSLANICAGILQGIGKSLLPVITIALGAVIKIIFNYFLIPIASINVSGSILSTTACYMVASIIDVWFLERYTRVKIDFNAIFGKPLVAATVMGIVCWLTYSGMILFIKSNTIVTLIAIAVSVAVYAIVLLLIKGITKADIEMFPAGRKLSKLLIELRLLSE